MWNHMHLLPHACTPTFLYPHSTPQPFPGLHSTSLPPTVAITATCACYSSRRLSPITSSTAKSHVVFFSTPSWLFPRFRLAQHPIFRAAFSTTATSSALTVIANQTWIQTAKEFNEAKTTGNLAPVVGGMTEAIFMGILRLRLRHDLKRHMEGDISSKMSAWRQAHVCSHLCTPPAAA